MSSDSKPRDVQRVFASFDHPCQPVDGGVGVAVSHRLVQSGNQVEVLLTGLVVQERPTLEGAREQLEIDPSGASVPRRSICAVGCLAGGDGGGKFEEVERDARIAVGVSCDRLEHAVTDLQRVATQPAVPVVERAPEHGDDVGGLERLQYEHFRSRQQGRVDLERRVFGCRSHEHDISGLDPRQERVLLRPVEPVDLIDKQDGALLVVPSCHFGFGHD